MKYKYSRKEIVKMYDLTDIHNGYRENEIARDLLAQKEDNKECKHKFGETYTGGKRCNKCNISLTEFKYSTPSPQEESKDIRYPILNEPLPEEITNWIKQVTDILNSLTKRNIK